MSRKRNVLVLVMCLTLFAGILVSPAKTSTPKEKRIRVLCSVFPMYLFTQNVARGSSALDIVLLLPPGLGCPHDYSLTPQDIQKISRGDVLIVNGLGLEEFIGSPLKRANPHIKVVDASKGITPISVGKEEEEKKEEGETHHHEAGYNPHLFSSPRQAAKQVENIGKALAQIDPSNRDLCLKNAKAYAAKLNKLADALSAAVKTLPSKNIVTVHEVFDYLAKDTGLEIAAVIEARPGTEPSASDMLAAVKKIKTSNAAAVFTEPQYSPRVGRTIAQEAGVPVATLDPVASGPVNAPKDYYEKTMTTNLETLIKVLHGKR